MPISVWEILKGSVFQVFLLRQQVVCYIAPLPLETRDRYHGNLETTLPQSLDSLIRLSCDSELLHSWAEHWTLESEPVSLACHIPKAILCLSLFPEDPAHRAQVKSQGSVN